MGRRKTSRASGKCPVTFALDVFGDRWSLLILRDILFKQKRNYGEFLRSDEGISTNILANRLAKLESAGLVSKTRDSQNQTKYVYRLTKKSEALIPMMLEMIAWSVKYDPNPDMPDNVIEGAPPRLLERWHDDREALLAELVAQARTSRAP